MCIRDRKGQEVERKPRNITIFELAVEDGSGSDWDLRVRCSKGTYVRTLCHDIGQRLGCGGCMSSLRRTRAGSFRLEQAVTMEQILEYAKQHNPAELLMPVDALFAQHPALIVTLGQTEKLKHGAVIRDWHFADGTYRVYSETGESVSYTHLRAHETGRNLVCRLLLEKKKGRNSDFS